MKKLIVIIVALLVSLTVLAQKMVGNVVVRDAEGNIKEYYQKVTITSYEETEDGIITSVHFTSRGREYIICGVAISLEEVVYEERPTVVYVRPVYRYRYYDYWPAPRPHARPVPPRPRYHIDLGRLNPPPQQHQQPPHNSHHTGPGAPPRGNNHPRGRR